MGGMSYNDTHIVLPTLHGLVAFLLAEIIYIKAENSQTAFYFTGKELPVIVNLSLKECEARLRKKDFFRVHKSYMINLWHFKEFLRGKHGRVLLTNKICLNVSDKYREAFLTRMQVA